jgi:hypothetical protein
MSHSQYPNELFEILGDELRPVVRNNPGSHIRMPLFCPLQYYLHIRFGHLLPDFPMHDKPAVSIQKTAQIVKGPAYVYIGNIYMPVLMG